MRRLLDGRSRLQFPPPMWKVKRELARIGHQFDDFVLRVSGISLTELYLRYVINPRVIQKTGTITVGKRAAIYLIFPSDGLLASHILALDYIADCGYVPVVVSNLPLDAKAEHLILQKSAGLVIRPNFGYDFAAYRDGMKFLGTKLADLDYLAIFNDSTWFPAQPERNWLIEAEQTGYDYVGSVFHGGMNADCKWDFRHDVWRIDTNLPRYHYGSYSLLISGKVLRSAQFAQFWQDYRASNDKARTILGGEIGLTQMVVKAGFSHGATLDNSRLDSLLDELPLDRLRDLACNTMTPVCLSLRQLRLQLMVAAPPDRVELRNFILKSVVKEGPAYALVDFDVRDRSGNFIKKSSVALDQTAGKQTLDLLRQLPSPQAAVFLEEATAVYRMKHGEKTPT